MKKIVLVLCIAFALNACSLNSEGDSVNCGDYTNVPFSGFPLSCNYSIKTLPENPTALIVTSQEKMNSYLTLHENTCANSPSPSVDFTQNFLVGIFSGQKPSGGYAIKMTTVVENSCEIVINFYERSPLTDEIVTQATTYPSDFILIPKTSKPIYFNRVNETSNTILIGSFYGECSGIDCQNFYQLNDYSVLRFLNVAYANYDFGQYKYNSLNKKGEYSLLLKTVPTEILNLKGQTKTYGSPDSHDQGGLYFELRQGIYNTKIYFDNDATTDQSAEIILFKKAIQDKINALKPN